MIMVVIVMVVLIMVVLIMTVMIMVVLIIKQVMNKVARMSSTFFSSRPSLSLLST